MAIGIYMKWRLARIASTFRKDTKDPLTYIMIFIVLVVVAFFRNDTYSIIAGVLAMVLLWIYADYRKGEHMHWYRQQYKKKTEAENNGRTQGNSDDRNEGD
jgi:NhaP-type Na+/H+ or K+/H+ antiporter